MKEIFKKNWPFIFPYLVLLITGILTLSLFSKADIHIKLNQLNTRFLDIFFYYLTYLGDGIFAVTVIMLMLFIRFRNFFFMGLSALVSLGVVQILKNYVFADELRPHAYFDWVKPYKLHFVDGVDINGFNSFPSGHTMSAFCIFFGLALIIKNKWLKFLFLIIAVLTGYSRVYLSEHFLIDIVAGSFIGVFFTLIIYCFFSHIHNNWIDKSFISLIRKSSAK